MPDVIQGKGNVVTGEGGNIVIGDNNDVHTVDPNSDPNFFDSSIKELRDRFNIQFGKKDNAGIWGNRKSSSQSDTSPKKSSSEHGTETK